MNSFIEKARKIHRNQKGFTLIELLVGMAFLTLLVGLVLLNFFRIVDEIDSLMIQDQHKEMFEAGLLYYQDTGRCWIDGHVGSIFLAPALLPGYRPVAD